MVSSSSSSSSSSPSCCSKEAKDTEQPRRPHFVPNCVYPFLRPKLATKPTGSSPPSPPPITIHQLHDAVASAIDNFSTRLRHLLASTFSSRFNLKPHFIQVRRAGFGNATTSLGFAAVLPGDSVAGLVVANGVLSFLSLYNTLLVVRLVLTWFPNAPPAIVSPLSTLCDPYLNIFRGIIPPLGGTLDLSPILAFLVLEAFTSTAKALPAELPPAAQHTLSSKRLAAAGVTSLQEKWLRRLQGKNTKGPCDSS